MSGPDVNASGQTDGAGTPVRDSGTSETPSHPPRRRRWLRAVLLALAIVLAVVFGAAGWLVLDPGALRPVAERVATAVTGRTVVIDSLDLRWTDGRAVIDATGVRVGRTTTERVSIILSGMRSHAQGAGVRFPNGSSLEQFRATLDLAFGAVPRVSTVDAMGAVLVTARREPADPAGPPPLARLLAVPRILLGLGLERLVLHSGTIEYRGRASDHSAGLTAVLATRDEGLSLQGEIHVTADMPPIPFTGTVRDPMTEEWAVDIRLAADGIPMKGVRFLTGVLEPGPTVRATLARISNVSRFVLSSRLAPGGIETVDLDFTFGAAGPAGPDSVDLEGVRLVTRAVPDPAGWTVAGEVDWTRLPGGEQAERTPFTVRWATGVPGSLRWSARRIEVPLLAHLADRALGSRNALATALERFRPTGTIDELAAFGDPAGHGDSTSFWMSAVLSGFGVSGGEWRISDAGARLEFAGGEWRLRFVNDAVRASFDSFRSTPYDLTLRGEVRATPTGDGWSARTDNLDVAASGISARVVGSLTIPVPDRTDAPVLDAEVRFADAPLENLASLLPDLRAAGFSGWYRRAIRSGRLTGAALKVRGDPREIPFADGAGTFEARGTVRDAELAYAPEWPPVRADEAEFRAHGKVLEFTRLRGTIFDSAIEEGSARIDDITDVAGRVRISLSGSGPARDLLEFVRTSPLGAQSEDAAADLHADGSATTTVALDVPYGRDAKGRPLGARGAIELDGVAFRLAGREAVLQEVAGGFEFDAQSVAGGPLHGRFQGEDIELHVEFERNEGLRLRFAGEGDGDWFKAALQDLVNLTERESAPWLAHVHGRAAWEAEYRGRSGIVFRSDLRAASVDFPPPFDKPAGTARRLEVRFSPGSSEWRVEGSYGPGAKGVFEVRESNGEWRLARGGIVLGGDVPALPAGDHIEITGWLADLDLDPWFAFAAPGPSGGAGWLERIGRMEIETDTARAFGRRIALRRLELAPAGDGSGLAIRLAGEGLAGEALVPFDPAARRANVHLDRLHFGARLDEEGERDEAPMEERPPGEGAGVARWPAFDARIDSLRFDGIDMGAAAATGNRIADGLEFEDVRIDAPDFRMRGHGNWTGGEGAPAVSRMNLSLDTDDLHRLLARAGVEEDAAAAGDVSIHLELAWPGSPADPSMGTIEGEIALSARDGRLPKVRVGPVGRLLALLSLNALPRVLSLDLSHVFSKGLAYNRIDARTHVDSGTASIRELTISGPSARIEVSGNLDLVDRLYDQEIEVVPSVTTSGVLIPVWLTIWPVIVGDFVLGKVSGKEVSLNRLFTLKYRLQGSWDDPDIQRIKVPQTDGEAK